MPRGSRKRPTRATWTTRPRSSRAWARAPGRSTRLRTSTWKPRATRASTVSSRLRSAPPSSGKADTQSTLGSVARGRDLVIQRRQPLRGQAPGIALLGERATALAQSTIAGAAVQEIDDGAGELGRSLGIDEELLTERAQDLDVAAHAGGDDGRAAGQGLQRDQPEAFEGARGHDEQVRALVVAGEERLGNQAGEVDRSVEPEVVRPLAKPPGEPALAADDEACRRALGPDGRERVQQILEPHARDQSPDAQHQRVMRGQGQARPRGRAIRRTEALEVHAPRDDAHGVWRAARRHRVQQPGGVPAEDDARRAAHDARLQETEPAGVRADEGGLDPAAQLPPAEVASARRDLELVVDRAVKGR